MIGATVSVFDPGSQAYAKLRDAAYTWIGHDWHGEAQKPNVHFHNAITSSFSILLPTA